MSLPSLRQSWEHIEGWKDGRFLSSRDDWQIWLDDVREHEDHEKMCKCKGCGRAYCKHLSKYVCDMYPVCQSCDDTVQPNPFNPINRKHVEMYCATKKRLLDPIQ